LCWIRGARFFEEPSCCFEGVGRAVLSELDAA
jgi:hypothetical protein